MARRCNAMAIAWSNPPRSRVGDHDGEAEHKSVTENVTDQHLGRPQDRVRGDQAMATLAAAAGRMRRTGPDPPIQTWRRMIWRSTATSCRSTSSSPRLRSAESQSSRALRRVHLIAPRSVEPGVRSITHVLHHRQLHTRLSGVFVPPLTRATTWPSEPIRRPTCSQGSGAPSGREGLSCRASELQWAHRPCADSSTDQTSSVDRWCCGFRPSSAYGSPSWPSSYTTCGAQTSWSSRGTPPTMCSAARATARCLLLAAEAAAQVRGAP